MNLFVLVDVETRLQLIQVGKVELTTGKVCNGCIIEIFTGIDTNSCLNAGAKNCTCINSLQIFTRSIINWMNKILIFSFYFGIFTNQSLYL